MRKVVDIAHTGLQSLVLYPLRSCVTVLCLLVVLVPYLTGIGISHGLRREAEISVQEGPDLYVSGEQFGRAIGIPIAAAEAIRGIDGVEQVTPRIVGDVTLGVDQVHAVVVGLPGEALPASVDCVRGQLFAPGSQGDLVLGSELARRLRLDVGDRIPPFYRSRQGERVSRIVGIFDSQATLWQAHVMFTSLQTAAEIFDQPGMATELLVDCRTGYTEGVRRQIGRQLTSSTLGSGVQPRVTQRRQLLALLPSGVLHREGVFNLHFTMAFVVGALAIMVSSGFGLSERRREVGVLKALGWQTDEVLLRSLTESLLLSLLGAALAIVLTYLWLKGLNGFWVAGIFLADVDAYPEFRIPFSLSAIPVILSFIFALVMVMSGTLYSTWRAATVSPRQAMR